MSQNDSRTFQEKCLCLLFLLVASIMEINWNVKFDQVRHAKQSKTTRTELLKINRIYLDKFWIGTLSMSLVPRDFECLRVSPPDHSEMFPSSWWCHSEGILYRHRPFLLTPAWLKTCHSLLCSVNFCCFLLFSFSWKSSSKLTFRRSIPSPSPEFSAIVASHVSFKCV